jgi:hypothetical protein
VLNGTYKTSTNQEGAMKKFLIFTAMTEGLAGLILLLYPPIVIWPLFDSEITGAGVLMSRIAGVSLIALAVACWPDRNTPRAFLGMLTYSLLAMLFLVYVGANVVAGTLLWPAAAVHAGLAVLLVRAWRKERHSLEANTYNNPGSESATLTPADIQKLKEEMTAAHAK